MILFPKHILSDFCSNRFRDSQTLESPFLYKLCSSSRYKAAKLLSSFDDFSKSLLRQDMKQIIINLETSEIYSLDKTGHKDAIAKASKKRMSCCR
ncbi:hypothetical protein YC2023_107383 [Brassica napus]